MVLIATTFERLSENWSNSKITNEVRKKLKIQKALSPLATMLCKLFNLLRKSQPQLLSTVMKSNRLKFKKEHFIKI